MYRVCTLCVYCVGVVCVLCVLVGLGAGGHAGKCRRAPYELLKPVFIGPELGSV